MIPIDAWTLGHIAYGFIAAGVRLPFWPTLALALGWEWFEETDVEPLSDWYFGNVSPLDGALDVIVALLAWCLVALARTFPTRSAAQRP